MDDAHVKLPDGHLVNLSPRSIRPGAYKAYRVEYNPSKELSATPPPRYPQERRSPEYAISGGTPANISQLPKATKLPVPRSFTERLNDNSSQTPSPTALPKLTPSSRSLGRLGDQSKTLDKGHDQYWRKIRDKLEDSPLLARRARSKGSDNSSSPNSHISHHRSRLPASTSQDQTSFRAGSAPSGIPGPNTVNTGPAQGSRNDAPTTLPVDGQNKWRKEDDQWVILDATETSPQKSVRTDATSGSSLRSHPSVSPVSAEDSSITDWEDRFVVNMPTAKDPNPPTMTAQQIAEYQRSIERVHRDGGQMADPNTVPSRNVSPEIRHNPSEQRIQSPREITTYDGAYERRQVPILSQEEHYSSPQPQQNPQPEQLSQPQPQQPQPLTASQRQVANHYYSPDEIGYNRISTIWEESPPKLKDKRHPQNADGSFLGCREISGEKNPDEILRFASLDDASLHPLPLALGSKKKQKASKEVKIATDRETTNRVEETVILQEERLQSSQNSRPAQCSKPSAMYQDRSFSQNPSPIPRTRSQDSSKENYHPTSNISERSGSLEENRGDDDVFIITPTITRTMIPTPDKKASSPKPQGLRRPGGTNTVTAEAIKAVRAKAQMVSTPSGLRPGGPKMDIKPTGRTLTTSQTLPLSSTSATLKDQDDESRNQDHAQDRNPERVAGTTSNTIRGFIRTTGRAKPSGLARSSTDSLATILRNRTESLRTRAESLRNGSGSPQRANQKQSPSPQPILPSRDNSESSRSERSFQSKETPTATPNRPASPNGPPSANRPPSPNKPASPSKTALTEIKPDEPSARPTAPSKPVKKKVTLSEGSPLSTKPDKPPTSTKKISALAKPSKLDKIPKPTKTAVSEKPPPPKTKTPDTSPKKEVQVKSLPRLQTSGKVLEIAELDGLQVSSPKESLQSNITDFSTDIGDMHSEDKGNSEGQGPNPLALSLIFNILVVAVTQVNKAVRMGTDNPYVKCVANNTLNMTSHCWHVSKCIYTVVSRYRATGTWPRPRSDQAISRFMVELLQAIVYLLILGFAAMLIARVIGYVVLVSSWIAWFVRPFAWAFQCVGRALIM
ncbi:hypothetical protein DTO013E5_2040 [Penicillium roqueforti]|uniref:Genomic scaffold, ProqFM164S02 n=1 Tax=Penicillium roqueforti (strain FM164) TaxID=1365484 RepID=W6QC16_PENRF|nr:hypothetical protein CBS147355_6610 [Penicillium roqueforti]CDM31694.1 unnamed protein product [Penicillium roqueforti FM164]KAI2698575.1 hypothetical protein CBS147372_7105 [Penicillium roqueforti]KAI2720861.1 hypothetical protein CBS147332_4101 [Penicillium roqueforti]KAI2740973.1 hypothetical protein DTO012A1_4747 [Penicillium roqueforti]